MEPTWFTSGDGYGISTATHNGPWYRGSGIGCLLTHVYARIISPYGLSIKRE